MVKQSDNAKKFILELKLYRWYEKSLATLKEDYDLVLYEMSGVKGVDPSKEPIHSPPSIDRYYYLSGKLSKIENEINEKESFIKKIDAVLSQFEDDTRTIITERYIYGQSLEKTANKHYMSPSGLNDKIFREIKKVLN